MPEYVSRSCQPRGAENLCLPIPFFANLPGFSAVQGFAKNLLTFRLHPPDNKDKVEALKRLPR